MATTVSAGLIWLWVVKLGQSYMSSQPESKPLQLMDRVRTHQLTSFEVVGEGSLIRYTTEVGTRNLDIADHFLALLSTDSPGYEPSQLINFGDTEADIKSLERLETSELDL